MTAFVFFILMSAREGEGWFEGDYLINSLQKNKKQTQTTTQLLNSFKFCAPVVFYLFWFIL
jgi:hypothetical protein